MATPKSSEMKEMTMLDLSRIDLSTLAEALEDNSYEHEWYLDRVTGEVVLKSEWLDDEVDESDDSNLVEIGPIGSDESYRDLLDFCASVRDPRARDLLMRAIEGRGAFRRFKGTLFEFPELRQAWFAFHDGRQARRAIEWLVIEKLVDERQAEAALAEIQDPDLPELSGAFDPREIAEDVAAELKRLYGDRIKKLLLYGSWVRGDAHPESDLDIVVVLDRIDSWAEERDRMDDILWKHSIENSTLVSALIVSRADYELGGEPVLARAKKEGIEMS